MPIANSTEKDVPKIFELYKQATDFQKIKFPQNQWPEFDEELIQKEVRENRQFKLLMDNKIACIWAITFSDPEIWEERDNNFSIYLHRIATNPNFRGNNLIKQITEWAKEFALAQNKKFIRMDTCGINERLIAYYTSFGFKFLGVKRLPDPSNLPAHYQNADVCLFEIALD